MSAASVAAIQTASSAADLAAAPDASWTIREIAQQPQMWRHALANLDEQREALLRWLQPILANPAARIILTGAGTSAYAGEMIAPALTRMMGRRVEAIATTDIVASPRDYLLPDAPTLLVSFSRSGSSPESIAAVELTEQLVADSYQLILCCNADSALVRAASQPGCNAYCLLMPPETLDRSFAMTSSITSMVVTALAIFADQPAESERLIGAVERLLTHPSNAISTLIGDGLRRAIFLGSGGLAGAAREAALKCLELSGGRTVAVAESSLGVRHGPKFSVDADSVVVVLTDADPYTRRYDQDIAAELDRDGTARTVIRLDTIEPFEDLGLADPWLGVAYLVWCQLLAYCNAVALGIAPDNPSPNGEVNRVVQGVVIHPFGATDA